MPPANAGGLTPATYASIVAFFASESGYPSGNVELPGDADAADARIAISESDIGPSP